MTLVVNFFAGSGAGKSALAAHTFALLKWQGINCELVQERAKELVWEKSTHRLSYQMGLFAAQHERISRLVGNVDVVLCDSPLLLTLAYDTSNVALHQLALEEHRKLTNLNIFVGRVVEKYEAHRGGSHGQNIQRSMRLDEAVRNVLVSNNISYTSVTAGPQVAASTVVPLVLRDMMLNAPMVK